MGAVTTLGTGSLEQGLKAGLMSGGLYGLTGPSSIDGLQFGGQAGVGSAIPEAIAAPITKAAELGVSNVPNNVLESAVQNAVTPNVSSMYNGTNMLDASLSETATPLQNAVNPTNDLQASAQTPVANATAPINGATPNSMYSVVPQAPATSSGLGLNPGLGASPSAGLNPTPSNYFASTPPPSASPGFFQTVKNWAIDHPYYAGAAGVAGLAALKAAAKPNTVGKLPDNRKIKYYGGNPYSGASFMRETPVLAASGGIVALAQGGRIENGVRRFDIGGENAAALASAYNSGSDNLQSLINSMGVTQADVNQYFPGFDVNAAGLSLPGQTAAPAAAPAPASAPASAPNTVAPPTDYGFGASPSSITGAQILANDSQGQPVNLSLPGETQFAANTYTQPSAMDNTIISYLQDNNLIGPGGKYDAAGIAAAEKANHVSDAQVQQALKDYNNSYFAKQAEALFARINPTVTTPVAPVVPVAPVAPTIKTITPAPTPTPTSPTPPTPTGMGITTTPNGTVLNTYTLPDGQTVTLNPVNRTTENVSTPTNIATAPAGALASGVGGNNALVNPNGTISQPVVSSSAPGMQAIRDAYTRKGGSLGYVNPAAKPVTTDAATQHYLDMLSGKKPMSKVPYTPTGEIAKPYYTSVMGMPENPRYTVSQPTIYDPVARKYVPNPNYDPAFSATADYVGDAQTGLSQKTKDFFTASGTKDPSIDTKTLDKAVAISNAATSEDGTPADFDSTAYLSAHPDVAAEVASGKLSSAYQHYLLYGAQGSKIKDPAYAYTKKAAGGGLMALAAGGMPGIGTLGGYSDGGRLLRGPGDGISDSIPATIGARNPQPARLADGEFVVPARIVSELGNGSTEAGARKLYQMMDRVQNARKKTTGKKQIAANPRAEQYLPV